jgi:3-oxoacyl-[acyl-carrier protein] reductase
VDLGIAGKVVFFTGGSKGMGRIAAKMLADEGCAVAIVARSQGPVAEAVNKIVADISQPDQVTAAVDQVTRELGAPSIVVGQTLFNRPGNLVDGAHHRSAL